MPSGPRCYVGPKDDKKFLSVPSGLPYITVMNDNIWLKLRVFRICIRAYLSVWACCQLTS